MSRPRTSPLLTVAYGQPPRIAGHKSSEWVGGFVSSEPIIVAAHLHVGLCSWLGPAAYHLAEIAL